jgi:DNA ligase-1
MTFKPMLASNVEEFETLKFPALVSPKLDGIRASMQEGKLLSRSLKPIPNKRIQRLFSILPEGTDGELIQGNPADDPYRRTLSIVMSDDKPIDGVRLYIFDRYAPSIVPFVNRFQGVNEWYQSPKLMTAYENMAGYEAPIKIVPHLPVATLAELEACEQEFLSRGYEGLMMRSLTGPYKTGRSSVKEGYLLKVKRFRDAEARIEDYYEEMENQNVAFTNELGRTARSSHKAGKVGKNQLGGFHVIGVGGTYDGIRFDVPSGAMCHDMRKELWKTRDLVDKLVIYKYFPTGGDIKAEAPDIQRSEGRKRFELGQNGDRKLSYQ